MTAESVTRNSESIEKNLAGLAKAGDGLGFVLGGGNCVEQPEHSEDELHIPARTQQFEAPASTLQGHIGAHDRADARGIDLREVGEIDQYFGGAGVNELPQLIIQAIGSLTDRRSAQQVKDNHLSGAPH
jgi:hypothetical protein